MSRKPDLQAAIEPAQLDALRAAALARRVPVAVVVREILEAWMASKEQVPR